MKKKLVRVLIVIIVIGVLAWAGLTFLLPGGFNSETAVVQSFLDNQASEDVCEEHFNPETLQICEAFVDGLDGVTYTVDSTVKLGSEVIVTISVGSTSESFTFTFIEEESTVNIPLISSSTYKIDTIE